MSATPAAVQQVSPQDSFILNFPILFVLGITLVFFLIRVYSLSLLTLATRIVSDHSGPLTLFSLVSFVALPCTVDPLPGPVLLSVHFSDSCTNASPIPSFLLGPLSWCSFPLLTIRTLSAALSSFKR